MEEIIKILTEKKETISTMESCTGGGFVNAITNIPGASEVLKFSAVTYSNEYKIKMGVSKEIIDTYTVYSIETAKEMAKNISKFTGSDYGIGITGKLGNIDVHNQTGNDNEVFVSIYEKKTNRYIEFNINVDGSTREKNKEEVINKITKELLTILS